MLNRNGVFPVVAAYRRGGLLGGIKAEGFSRRPAHTEVIGKTSAKFIVCRTTWRTLLYPSPGRLPRHASTAFTVSSRAEYPALRIVLATRAALSSTFCSSTSAQITLEV